MVVAFGVIGVLAVLFTGINFPIFHCYLLLFSLVNLFASWNHKFIATPVFSKISDSVSLRYYCFI